MIGQKIYKTDFNAEEYSSLAEWCNTSQEGYIVDQGEYYECVAIPQPTDEEKLAKAKADKRTEMGKAFAEHRDAIRWIALGDNTYGFDCASEDMVNFMSAYTPILVAGEGECAYKVWLTEDSKGIVTLAKADMDTIYQSVRTSQLQAYAQYEVIRASIDPCTTVEEVNAIQWNS